MKKLFLLAILSVAFAFTTQANLSNILSQIKIKSNDKYTSAQKNALRSKLLGSPVNGYIYVANVKKCSGGYSITGYQFTNSYLIDTTIYTSSSHAQNINTGKKIAFKGNLDYFSYPDSFLGRPGTDTISYGNKSKKIKYRARFSMSIKNGEL